MRGRQFELFCVSASTHDAAHPNGAYGACRHASGIKEIRLLPARFRFPPLLHAATKRRGSRRRVVQPGAAAKHGG